MRESRRAYRATVGKAAISATAADASGKLVIEADRIAKSYDGRPIVHDFSIRIQRGDRIGIIGPNGSGKTTLINLLTGALAPDAGAVRLGANLAVATLDQRTYFTEVSSDPQKRPARMDWTFVFKDTRDYGLPEGEPPPPQLVRRMDASAATPSRETMDGVARSGRIHSRSTGMESTRRRG